MTIKSFYISSDGTAFVPLEINTPPAKVVLCGSNAEAVKHCREHEECRAEVVKLAISNLLNNLNNE